MANRDAVEVVLTHLDVAPDAVRASAAVLSDAERQRANRFAFERDRRRFIIARSRLRHLLGTRLRVPPGSIELAYGEHGKPALAQRFAESELRFNVSYAGDVAVFAFSSGGREIGVDIEAVRAIPEADAIAARVFSRCEHAAYRALAPWEKPLGFFNCWTRKEAFVKALGDGLHHPLDRFDVSLAPSDPARILRVGNTSGDGCGWALHAFVPGAGLVGAVVVRTFAHEPPPTRRPDTLGVRARPRRDVAGRGSR